jgi:hypothetical protein
MLSSLWLGCAAALSFRVPTFWRTPTFRHVSVRHSRDLHVLRFRMSNRVRVLPQPDHSGGFGFGDALCPLGTVGAEC